MSGKFCNTNPFIYILLTEEVFRAFPFLSIRWVCVLHYTFPNPSMDIPLFLLAHVETQVLGS
jgi:hypothetical protein